MTGLFYRQGRPVCSAEIRDRGTHEDERTVLYKTKSLDGTKPNTNPKTNHNPNPKLTQNTNAVQLFYAFFEHRLLISSLAETGLARESLDGALNTEPNTNPNPKPNHNPIPEIWMSLPKTFARGFPCTGCTP